MRAERFFDTNVLVYAFGQGDERCERALALLQEGGVVGVQALNEFSSIASRELGWSWGRISEAVDVVVELLGPARPLTGEIHAAALLLAARYRVPFYDALVLAAAADAGCAELVSEDFQHGRRYSGVRVRNPFRH